MHINFTAILVYVSTLSAALLSVADVLPLRWLPFIIVAGKIADAFTPRAAKRRARPTPPTAGRGQSGRASLALLLAMLALCLSLPFLTTGCPRSKGGGDPAAELVKRASRVASVADNSASDIETAGGVVRSLHAGRLVSDEGARAIAQAALDANSTLAEGVNQSLSYGTLDEFSRANIYEHLDRFRAGLASLNERGTLHIKSETSRALFAALLIASDLVLRRVLGDMEEKMPAGVSIPLDGDIRRKLERARDTCGRNDKALREFLEQLGTPAPTPSPTPAAGLS